MFCAAHERVGLQIVCRRPPAPDISIPSFPRYLAVHGRIDFAAVGAVR